MPYEQERLALNSLLTRAAYYWDSLSARLPSLPRKWVLPLCLVLIAAHACLLRSLHLLNSSYHYLLSPDSYFFHWMAGKVMAGEEFPAGALPGAVTGILHSGLAYPLAYIAKALSYILGLSSADALELACKILPILLALISILLIYLVATKICDWRIGLFSAFAWAIMLDPVHVGTAGYIDRDGLSLLLVMGGSFLFYLSRSWHLHIGSRDMGWLVAGLGILAIEVLLYFEWTFVGPILLLSVLITFFVLRFLLGYFDRLEIEPNVIRRLSGALGDANSRVFGVLVLAHVVFAAANANLVSEWLRIAAATTQLSGQKEVSEMTGISIGNILNWQFLLIPILFGLYIAWRRRSEGAIFFAAWFLSLLILSLFTKRILIYAAPGACLLSGVGLGYIWDQMKRGQLQVLKRIGVAVLLCLLVFFSFSSYYAFSSPALSADEDWQDALAYIRESTSQEAIVLSQWSWGYWILDLGQRRPVVDNGFYGWDFERLHDTGLAYVTTEPSEAVRIMEKYDADYLVFGDIDRNFAQSIMGWVDKEQYKGFTGFPSDSMFERCLEGGFESGGGLEVVYRSSPESKVVVLGLTQHTS